MTMIVPVAMVMRMACMIVVVMTVMVVAVQF
jgi:hypothetical protein